MKCNMCESNCLLTAKDLQNIFGCSKNRAYDIMHAKGFPSIQIGRRYYTKKSDLDTWLETWAGRQFII